MLHPPALLWTSALFCASFAPPRAGPPHLSVDKYRRRHHIQSTTKLFDSDEEALRFVQT